MFKSTVVNASCEKALKAIANGDKNALSTIYDKMYKPIYSVAWSVLKNHADAEDATQNTLCEILRCAQSYRGGSARAWILSVARNQALNIARIRSRETATENFDESISALKSNAEARLIYLEALGTLKLQERQAVVLKVYCHLKHKEIAEILGITPAAAEKLYQRGIKKLRDYYE